MRDLVLAEDPLSSHRRCVRRSIAVFVVLLGLAAAPAESQGAYSVNISPADPEVGEGVGTVDFTATLVGCTNPADNVFPEILLQAGPTPSGTPGVDTGSPTPNPIALGQSGTTATFQVPIVDDSIQEPDENLRVILDPAGGTLTCDEGILGPSPAQFETGLKILDDDITLTISVLDASVTEGDSGTTTVDVTVELSAPPPVGTVVSADLVTQDGSATLDDGDYVSATRSVEITSGQTSTTASFQVQGDTRDEGDESFFVSLQNVQGASIADGQAEITILDDDITVTISVLDASVTEGDSGTTTVEVPVELSAPAPAAVVAELVTQDGSATVADGDYVSASRSLEIPSGQTTTTASFQVQGDTRDEDDESFFVSLQNVQGANIGDGQAEITILDDDEPTPSNLRIGDTGVTEGDSGTRDARFAVELTPASSRTVTVDYATADGSARAGEDYRATSGTLEFPPGATSRTIHVPVFGDRQFEGDETFSVELSNPVGAVLEDARGRATIQDDDPRPLEIDRVGTEEQTVRPGETVDLQVRVTDEDTGTRVPDVSVNWEIEGDATVVGSGESSGATSLTDDAGVATLTLRLGETPGEVRVTAALPDGDSVGFRIQIRSDFGSLFEPDAEPGPRSVADVLDQSCLEATAAFRELCLYLFGLEDAEVRETIRELVPREAAGMAILAREGARAQLRNVLTHLAAARRGSRGGLDRLSFVIQGHQLAATSLTMTPGGSEREELRLAALMDEALPAAQEPGGAEPEPELPHRWSIFASGRVSSGDREDTPGEAGFDLETAGVTLGVDYQASPRWLLGFAGGWLESDNEFVRDGGFLEAEGYSASVFAGYAREAFYLDLVGSWGENDYEILRNVDLPVPFRGRTRLSGRGEPSGDQTALALGIGYDAFFGATNLGFFARGSWVEATIDPFVESGAGPVSLALEEQDLESLLSEAGLEITRAVSTSWGVFLPQLRLAWLHELEDDARLVRGRFVQDRDFLEFVVPTDVPDADYFNAGLGFTATLPRGWSLYLFADQDLDRDDLDLLTVSGGFRIEL